MIKIHFSIKQIKGLARFATEKYVAPKANNLTNNFIHLTNYAINKNNPNFEFN